MVLATLNTRSRACRVITTLLILAENKLLSPLSILITETRPLGRTVREDSFLFASSLQRMSAFFCALCVSSN